MEKKLPTREEIEDLYLNKLLTDGQIAKMFGTYQVRISRLRRKYGITTLDKTGRIEASVPELTPLQRELILGSLLGDGYIRKNSERTASFCESHSEKQEEYLRWKGEILGAHVSSYTKTTKRSKGKVFRGWRLTGVTSTHMKEFYDLFYDSSGRRQFPDNLKDFMTPFVLAIWYMDDGSILKKFHPRITFGLDDKSLENSIEALRNLGLSPTVGKEKSGHCIRFPGQADKFFELVGPHVPECMRYKTPAPSEFRTKAKNAALLTPEKAGILYSGGMKMQEIAGLYGVGRSTVRRRLKEAGVKSREAVPYKAGLSIEAAESLLEPGGRPPEEVLEVLRKCGFPFPPMLQRHTFDREVELVRNSAARVEDGIITPWSSVGTRVCNPYFHNRYKALSRGTVSPYEAWFDDEKLLKAINFQIRMGDPVTPKRVLRAITMQHRTPSIFRPTVANWVYRSHCPPGGTVWDPCSGYGGRLLGAFTAGVRYIATDVEKETVEGNRSLAQDLGYEGHSIELCPAERFDPGTVDLVFTSPPYFDREIYSGKDDQSWVRHGSNFDSWVEGFLRPVISIAFKRSPKLVLNVADIRKNRKVIPLVDRTIAVAEEEGFILSERLWMPLARLNRSPEEAREPVLIFERYRGSNPSDMKGTH